MTLTTNRQHGDAPISPEQGGDIPKRPEQTGRAEKIAQLSGQSSHCAMDGLPTTRKGEQSEQNAQAERPARNVPARELAQDASHRVKHQQRWLVVSLPLAVLGVTLLACSIGPVATPLSEITAALLAPLNPIINVPEVSAATHHLIWSVRLPRVLLALLVGAGLAAAGTVMQAVFRNPLAEPGVTGVSSGAAVAAVLVLVTGAASTQPWLLPLTAFAGAVAAVTFVQVIAGIRGGNGATLLLVGIAINAFLGAVIAAIIANAPDAEDAQQAMFWLNGDLTASNWRDVAIAVIPILLGTVALLATTAELNLFLLGDDHAASSGMRTNRTRQLLLAVAALVTAAGVAVTGVISFVGLVVPHLVRLVLGPDHRILMPVSIGFGAIFLVFADLIARNLFDPVALQTGTVTAFIGAPVLLALVAKRGRA